MKFESTELLLAQKLDAQDPLKDYRNKFVKDSPNEIYLNGNSLGPLPIKTKDRLESVISKEWGERKVRGWNDGWIKLSEKVASKVAKIIGANEDEVLVTDSTSVNLYKLVCAALTYQKDKIKIVTDEFNFPSDLYVIQGILEDNKNQHNLQLVKSRDGITIANEDIENSIDNDTALVVLSHSCFKSSFLYDIKEITKLAHKKGALVLWDLSHSAGVVDIDLKEADVDLAIGCTYKYLNSGPGAPAYLFIKKELQDKLNNPIQGWFGHNIPFDFSLNYVPAQGIKKFQVGTPPIISLSAIDTSADLILEAGIKRIREKSIQQTDYLFHLVENLLEPIGFKIQSPKNSNERGSHIALYKEDAYSIALAAKSNNNGQSVILDFRKPGIIRLSVSPLYNTYEEIWKGIKAIEQVVKVGNYKEITNAGDVT